MAADGVVGASFEGMPRNPRTVSLLKLPDADDYPVTPLMIFLMFVAFAEGADNALFPSVTKALEKTVQIPDGNGGKTGFDIEVLGTMAMVQLLFQAAAGPAWGVLASRGVFERRTILGICTFVQGLATAVMWNFVANNTLLYILRAFNGVALAGLRPIANSIVGDRFDDEVRGKYFGAIMMALQLGVAITSVGATLSSEIVLWGEGESSFYGWQMSFLVVGILCMSLAPCIYLCMKAPPVIVKKNAEGASCASELNTIWELLKVPTFAVLVFQGCFGLIPWRAFDFRTFFFETAGLDKLQASAINASGGFAAAFGSLSGGWIGDRLNEWWPMHGRVLAAEIAVYGGIPFAYLTFIGFWEGQAPPSDIAFGYYLCLTIGLGLIAPWTPGACNNPVLCALAAEDERALILSWQASLEGAIGATGPFIFTRLLPVFGYDKECLNWPDATAPGYPAACDGTLPAAGQALFYTSCVPWLFCGMLYSCLHCTYPKDLKAIQDKREAEANSGGAELISS